MTAVIHHGPPGSFKTFSIVQRVMIPALIEGREVVTNIRGFDDIDRIARVMGVSIPDTAKVHYVEADTKAGFEYIARFFHWAPAGSLIVIDEAQRAYPTRLRTLTDYDQPDDIPLTNPDGTPATDANGVPMLRPATLENAFDQHRHFNWDIYLSTPNIGKVHREIKQVVQFAYRHRDMTGLNPFSKAQQWREFKHDPESSGKSTSHYIGTPKSYKVDRRIFECYKSTRTGKANSLNENTSVLRDPKVRLFLGIFLCSVLFVVYNARDVYQRFTRDDTPPAVVDDATPLQVPAENRRHDTDHDDRVVYRPPNHKGPAPLSDYHLVYAGTLGPDLLFHAYDENDAYVTLRSDDLEAMGYEIDHVGRAFVRLYYQNRRYYAFTEPTERPQARPTSGDTPPGKLPFSL